MQLPYFLSNLIGKIQAFVSPITDITQEQQTLVNKWWAELGDCLLRKGAIVLEERNRLLVPPAVKLHSTKSYYKNKTVYVAKEWFERNEGQVFKHEATHYAEEMLTGKTKGHKGKFWIAGGNSICQFKE